MTSAWDKLPREILKIIFQNLKEENCFHADHNLRESALVCHGWAPTAQEVLFSTIHMTSEEEVERLVYTVALKPTLARFVKSMHYNFQNFTSDRHVAHLAIIANFFPQLEQIHSFGFRDDVFYGLFCNLVKDGKLPNLKVFPDSHNKFQDELRAAVIISQMKDSITKLSLLQEKIAGRDDYTRFRDTLPHFSKLCNLVITVFSDESQDSSEYIESLTRSTTLREVKFNLCFPHQFSQPDIVQPVLNVKRLTLQTRSEVCADHSGYVCYLMKKFPNLKGLHLTFKNHSTLKDQWHIDSIQHNSATAAFTNQLFGYLSKLSNYSITFCYMDAASVTQLFRLYFQNMCAAEKSLVHLKVSSRSPSGDASLAFVGLTRKNKQSYISLQFCTKNPIHLLRGFLEEFGHYFKGLKMEDNRAFNLATDLNHISRYCTNLESLNVEGKIHEDYAEKTVCQSFGKLKRLTLREFSSELFPLPSLQFPCVETLVMQCKCSIGNKNTREDEESSHNQESGDPKTIYFDMKGSALQHFIFEVKLIQKSYADRLKNVYMKIATHDNGETKYIHLLAPTPEENHRYERPGFKSATDPTQDGYESTVGNQMYIHCEVKCASIKKLSIIEYLLNYHKLAIDFDFS